MESDAPAVDFLLAHRTIGVIVVGFFVFISLCLITRLWCLRHRTSIFTRLVWSLILLVPIFGWLFYAAFYRPPERQDHGGHSEHGQAAWSGDVGGH